MPHDKNGLVINPGDRVVVEFVVKTVTQTEEYCNATLETVEGMPPEGHKSSLTLNARQVVKK